MSSQLTLVDFLQSVEVHLTAISACIHHHIHVPVCCRAEDVQVEFVMLDPHVRTSLLPSPQVIPRTLAQWTVGDGCCCCSSSQYWALSPGPSVAKD